jgi:hypothetical protein
MANWDGVDNASYITDYWVQWGSTPGADDVAVAKHTANLTQAFAAMSDGTLAEPLVQGQPVYATVWARDYMGYYSERVSSNGVKAGGGEATVDPNSDEPAVVGFDMAPAGSGGADAGNPAKTMGGVAIPPGALGDGPPTTFLGGNVDDGTASNGTVNATAEAPPAGNFKFGGYSFTLKAAGPDGKVQEHFEFEEPITMFLYYNVWEVLKPGQNPEDVQPEMYLWDTKTEDWIQAADSCPPEKYRSEVDYVNNQYILNICHLTQFAMFVQDAPKAILEVSLLGDEYVAVGKLLPELRRVEEVNSMLPGARYADFPDMAQETGRPFVYVLQHGTECDTVLLDGANSYDTDGIVEQWLFSLHGAFGNPVGDLVNSSVVPHAIIDRGDGKSAQLQLEVPGLYLGSLTVVDDQAAERTAAVPVLLNEAPSFSPVADVLVSYSTALQLETLIIDLSVNATDPEGAPVAFEWEWISTASLTSSGVERAALTRDDEVPNLVPAGDVAHISNFAAPRTHHRLHVTAMDNDGGETSQQLSLRVLPHAMLDLNVHNVVNATYNRRDGKLVFLEGQSVASATVSAVGSVFPVDVIQATWQVNGTNASAPAVFTCEDTWSSGSCSEIRLHGLSRGTYSVLLEVEDIFGLRTSMELSLGINRKPEAQSRVHYNVIATGDSSPFFLSPAVVDPDGDELFHIWTFVNATSLVDGDMVPALDVKQSTSGDQLKLWGFHAPAKYHMDLQSYDGFGGSCISSHVLYALAPQTLEINAPSVWVLRGEECSNCNAEGRTNTSSLPADGIQWTMTSSISGAVIPGVCRSLDCREVNWENASSMASGTYELQMAVADESGYVWTQSQHVVVTRAPTLQLEASLLVFSSDAFEAGDGSISFSYTASDADGDDVDITVTSSATSGLYNIVGSHVACSGPSEGSEVLVHVTATDAHGASANSSILLRRVRTPTLQWVGMAPSGDDWLVVAPSGSDSSTFTVTATNVQTSSPLRVMSFRLVAVDRTLSGNREVLTAWDGEPHCENAACTEVLFQDVALGNYRLHVNITTESGLLHSLVERVIVDAAPTITATSVSLVYAGSTQMTHETGLTISSMNPSSEIVFSASSVDPEGPSSTKWQVTSTTDSRGADFVNAYLLLGGSTPVATLRGVLAATYELQATISDSSDNSIATQLTVDVNAVESGVSVHVWYAEDQAALVEGGPAWTSTVPMSSASSAPLVVVLPGQPTADTTVSIRLSTEAQNMGMSVDSDRYVVGAGSSNAHAIFSVMLGDDASVILPDIIEDAIEVSAVSGDFNFMTANAFTFSVLTADNDVADVAMGPIPASHTEGATLTFPVHLTARPSAEVTITLAADADDDSDVPDDIVVLSPSSWTVSPQDWDVPMNVTITSQVDSRRTGDGLITLNAVTSSIDTLYDEMEGTRNPTFMFSDVDTAELLVSGPEIADPNTTVEYMVALSSRPRSAVMVTISIRPADEQAATRLGFLDDALVPYVDTTSVELVFLPSTWNIPQPVSMHFPAVVQALGGPLPMLVLASSASNDFNFNAGRGAQVVSVQYLEQAAWMVRCEHALRFVDGSGDAVGCSIDLSHEPLVPLRFRMSLLMQEPTLSLDLTPVALSQDELLVFPNQWAQDHTFVLQVPPSTDGYLSGDSNGTLSVALGTLDPSYGQTTSDIILSVTFVDTDEPGVVVEMPSVDLSGTVDEGSTIECLLHLSARPTRPVTAELDVIEPTGRVMATVIADEPQWMPTQYSNSRSVHIVLERDWIEPLLAWMARDSFVVKTRLHSDDSAFDGVESVRHLTQQNVDRVGVRTTPATIDGTIITEGTPGIVVLAGLQTRPSEPVTLSLELNSTALNYSTTVSRVVDTSSWSVMRSLPVSFPRDEVNTGDATMHATLRISSRDVRYQLAPRNLGVIQVHDVDTPGLQFVPPALVLPEGGRTSSATIRLRSKPKAGRVLVSLSLQGDEELISQSRITPSTVTLSATSPLAAFTIEAARDGRFSGRLPLRVVATAEPVVGSDVMIDEQYAGVSMDAAITFAEADHSPGFDFDLHPRRWANMSSGANLAWLRLRKAHGVPSTLLTPATSTEDAEAYPALAPVEALAAGARAFDMRLFSKPWDNTSVTIDLVPDVTASAEVTLDAHIAVMAGLSNASYAVSQVVRDPDSGAMQATVNIPSRREVDMWQSESGSYAWGAEGRMSVLLWQESPNWEPSADARSVVLSINTKSLDMSYNTEVVVPTVFLFAPGVPPAIVGIGGMDFCGQVHGQEVFRANDDRTANAGSMKLALSVRPRHTVRVTFDVVLDFGSRTSTVSSSTADALRTALLNGPFAPITIDRDMWTIPVARELLLNGAFETVHSAQIRIRATASSSDPHYDGVSTTLCQLLLAEVPEAPSRLTETLIVIVGVAIFVAAGWLVYTNLRLKQSLKILKQGPEQPAHTDLPFANARRHDRVASTGMYREG